jgi:hypothetical protein
MVADVMALLANSEAPIWTATLGGNPRSKPKCLTGFRASSGLIVDFANSVMSSTATGDEPKSCR